MLEKTSTQSFDAIVIGSSPVLLLEALHLSKKGYKVGIFEEKPYLGGAWYTKSIWSLSDVEVACHYIERGRNNYDFLKTLLDIDLRYLPAHILWAIDKDEAIPSTKRGRTMKQIVNDSAPSLLLLLFGNRLISKRIWNVVARLREKRVEGDPLTDVTLERSQPHLYPVGGCRTIMGALMARIEEESIQTFTNSRVNLVDIDDARPHNLCWIGDESYKTEHVVTGQFVNFDVSVGGRPMVVNRKERSSTHVVLKVKGKKRRFFSYIDIRNSHLLKRITDVGAYAGYDGMLDPSELLLSCQVLPGRCSEVDLPNRVLSYLVDINLLNEDARLSGSHVEHYDSRGYVGSHELRRLQAHLPKSLEIMWTWDLGKSIEHYYPRWSSMCGSS